MVISPTMTYASRTWILTRKDDQDCATESASLYRTDERKYKPKKVAVNKKDDETEKIEDEDKEGTTDKETKEGSEQSSNKDQDSDLSCREDVDEEIDATENEEEWIETFFQKKKNIKETE